MKKLGTIDICGIPFSLIEGDELEFPGLRDAFGYTNGLGCQIVIRTGMQPQAFRNTVMHEIQHGIWIHSGLQQLASSRMDHHEFEEAHIQVFTPHLIEALRSLKKLKIQ